MKVRAEKNTEPPPRDSVYGLRAYVQAASAATSGLTVQMYAQAIRTSARRVRLAR